MLHDIILIIQLQLPKTRHRVIVNMIMDMFRVIVTHYEFQTTAVKLNDLTMIIIHSDSHA